jgi:hypothetical protein
MNVTLCRQRILSEPTEAGPQGDVRQAEIDLLRCRVRREPMGER